MPKRKQKKERLSVSVTEDQKAAIQEMADNSDVSLARVIQEAVKEFLEKHQDRRLPLFEKPLPKGESVLSAVTRPTNTGESVTTVAGRPDTRGEN
jgi:hypothetical protein